MTDGDPHADQPVVTAGAPASVADAVVVLLHGRGATAQGVVNLAEPLYRHGVTFVAPDAARSRWYPYSSFAPVERNEPHVSSALAAVDRALGDVREWGVSVEDVVLFGFSQGACIASEYAARNPRRYGGVAALSGGLLGEDVDPGAYDGSLDGARVFLGVGDSDPSVPVERVRETREVFEALGGTVTERVYAGVGHEVTDDEFAVVGSWLDGIVGETG
ncbi:alpha/beta fold hydrolase [Halobacterium sp. NMX12-1]|uniref:Alpha/beta fold hydrolase n=1 Tax=Halobacterium sp. NMX12-1 TaxID=3166650 RepID=A0AAU8C9C6_9EURY